MKRANRRRGGKGAIELIEEAWHLLRSASASALAAYYLGSLPFVFGLLFFWEDMSHSAFARRHIAEMSLVVAALFLWMKFWQAVFSIRIRAQFAGEAPPPLDFARCRRIFLTQSAIQPTGLFVLPLALVPALPFGWAYAFYQNLTALADAEPAGLRSIFNKSYRQAALWPAQNHLALGFMSLFGLFVFLNCTITCFILPDLVKMLFGIESIFTRGGMAMFNTTFFATMLGLTYLCVDPILKTIYALRCFYGDSVQSGEDLKAELRSFAVPAQRAAACLLVALTLAGTVSTRATDTVPSPAATPPPQTSPSGVSPAELDRAISEVIQQRKYSWRMPREKVVEQEAQKGFIARFFERVSQMLRKWIRATLNWLDELYRKLFGRSRTGSGEDSGYGWIWSLEILYYALLAVVIAAAAILLMRILRKRRVKPTAIPTQAIQPVPDLADENVGAEQLPEDGWTTLARELLARGEFRLALRAFYLASLAHLAEKNLVSIARFKSNRDYERELQRRGHSFPELHPLFAENVSTFDRSWYGRHEVTGELVAQFAANVERIKSAG